jgi:2-polyprenyl-3-methyl-5-hydroxy-6-metoxy-1,4-benzoquinol methylase
MVGLHWSSDLEEVLERAGIEALVRTDCPVCRSSERSFLFRKQGFAFHRCQECSHVYITPHISAELQAQIGAAWDSEDADNSYLKVQRMYAAATCQLLRARAPGNRLLDIGFGRGYLMELARAYGFEVFGIESSRAKVEGLRPRFGQRVHQAVVGQADIAWHSFDVIVMSHVLEHLPDPAASLEQVRCSLNPWGILYLAVPDIDSFPFKVFGKKWDVINPLVHLQYFCAASLTRLLQDCGFVNLVRIQQPAIPPNLASRWQRLLTRLGGSDSSELVFLAQVLTE